GGLDVLVHSLAYAPAQCLSNPFVETTRADFTSTLEISAYSLTALARAVAPQMAARGGGSILTLTYLGGERVVPNYNVMGVAKAALDASVKYLAYDLGPQKIRVNAISAGPRSTAASRGISGYLAMEHHVVAASPLKRGIELEDVGNAAVFLASDAAAAITGEILHVDSGYHAMGTMLTPER
ncbi:MAG TPA: SDR family oxidoreductase, partial [Dehalococcoidia bacterium]|nr:SDR family oxidoreductase [Dehalococcoidia bacterium]